MLLQMSDYLETKINGILFILILETVELSAWRGGEDVSVFHASLSAFTATDV